MATEQALLKAVKDSMGISDSSFDGALSLLVDSAVLDMESLGIDTSSLDALLTLAIICHVRANFGIERTEENERWQKAFEMNIAKLRMTSKYTDWGR